MIDIIIVHHSRIIAFLPFLSWFSVLNVKKKQDPGVFLIVAKRLKLNPSLNKTFPESIKMTSKCQNNMKCEIFKHIEKFYGVENFSNFKEDY